ncbi:hypothetical protein GH733_006430 [Mirounga leonina]|nr:hypothetical protein GH733_006430 [Mirounga leonina]
MKGRPSQGKLATSYLGITINKSTQATLSSICHMIHKNKYYSPSMNHSHLQNAHHLCNQLRGSNISVVCPVHMSKRLGLEGRDKIIIPSNFPNTEKPI